MSKYEFAVEYGFNFEYVEVVAESEKAAKEMLWNEVLTEDQKDSVSSIECTAVSA